tara:strand:- start:1397 stop:2401 length:1005 start_codon:yes stop_codon:yes gene_type:complete
MNVSELAQHLNLSPTTVSRALSGQGEKYRVSAATVQRVRQAAEKFHVSPDPLGTSLRSGKLGMIGLLVPDITNSFFAQLARCIELELRQHGMTVQLCDSNEDAAVEAKLLQQMLGRRLNGLIIAPVGRTSAEFTRAIESSPMPIIMLDRIVPHLNVPTISLDNVAAGRLAAEHLIKTGHQRIGCLRGDHESFTDRQRFRGVTEALADAGFEMNSDWISGSGYTQAASLTGAGAILDSDPRPDAVIALSGQGILGILEAAQELRVRIPEDVSIIAFDEQPWSSFANPPLTTVSQPTQQMAVEAVNSLVEPTSRPSLVLGANIIERKSVQLRKALE